MKTLSLLSLALLVTSASAFAADEKLIAGEALLNKLHFSARSDENGVCRALGFERAATGSSVIQRDEIGATLIATSTGLIEKGEVSGKKNPWIAKIVCINPGATPSLEQKPEYVQPALGQVKFSYESSDDGVCRAMGFERAASGSSSPYKSEVGPVMVAKEDGTFFTAKVSSGKNPWMSKVICINAGKRPITQTPILVNAPVVTPTYFSASSSQNGVCRKLGYVAASVGGYTLNHTEGGQTLVVDQSGKITGGELASKKNPWYAQILCIQGGTASLSMIPTLTPGATPKELANYWRSAAVLFYREKADFLEKVAKIGEVMADDPLEGAKSRLFLAEALRPFFDNVASDEVQTRVAKPYQAWLQNENSLAHITQLRDLDRDIHLDKLGLTLMQLALASVSDGLADTDQRAIHELVVAIGQALADPQLDDRKLGPVLEQLHDQEPMIAALLSNPRLTAFGQLITILEGYLRG